MEAIVINISRSCTVMVGTKYEVVEEAARELGWEVETSRKSESWDVMWIDSHIEACDLYKLNDHQRISHFPAIYVLTRKNFLGRSLMRMRGYFP
jgi:tubulin polyglutamylase TTLL6/13